MVRTRTTVLDRRIDGGALRRSVLPSGLRVLTEEVPGTRSAAVGMWVAVGSRDEPAEVAGAAHYLEHLLFKLLLQQALPRARAILRPPRFNVKPALIRVLSTRKETMANGISSKNNRGFTRYTS